MRKLLISFIIFYQKAFSPYLGGRCRYLPTCSDYAIDAVQEWGSIRGIIIGVARILRCHPFGSGGYDPAPIRNSLKGNFPLTSIFEFRSSMNRRSRIEIRKSRLNEKQQ